MAKINITPNQFFDIFISFFLDKMLHPDEVLVNNREFNDFIENVEGKGLKPILLKIYLDMDANQRLNYKRIKDVFDIGQDTMTINIKPKKERKSDE